MSDQKEMTPEQKRIFNKNEFKRKYSRFWLIYLALFGTGVLSGISGILLPIQTETGLQITFWTVLAGFYYAIGFLTNGEGAAYFWFDKLVDHDKDNTTQQVIAVIMLAIAVATILTTALASASFIAYLMGALDQFKTIPAWAQTWIVSAIPIFWVANFVTGVLFKALSDESAAERDARSTVRNIQTEIVKQRENARADYWKEHAPRIAKELGELEAQEEIANMTIRLESKRSSQPGRPMPATSLQPMAASAQAERIAEQENRNGERQNPTQRR
jgi:hypothetical protein